MPDPRIEAELPPAGETGAPAPAPGIGEQRTFMPGLDAPIATLQELDAHSRRALDAMLASVSAAAQGAQELAIHAAEYTRQMMEHQAKAAQSLATARSPQELMEAQAAYGKAALDCYVTELKRASSAMGDIINASLRPLSQATRPAPEKTDVG